MLKIIKFMERMWLMLAVVTFVIAIVRSFQYSIFDAVYFYGFSVIATLLFLMRRKQRRMQEREDDRS